MFFLVPKEQKMPVSHFFKSWFLWFLQRSKREIMIKEYGDADGVQLQHVSMQSGTSTMIMGYSFRSQSSTNGTSRAWGWTVQGVGSENMAGGGAACALGNRNEAWNWRMRSSYQLSIGIRTIKTSPIYHFESDGIRNRPGQVLCMW